jgi:hypothetical protein
VPEDVAMQLLEILIVLGAVGRSSCAISACSAPPASRSWYPKIVILLINFFIELFDCTDDPTLQSRRA